MKASDILERNTNFKINDKVRILKNDNPDGKPEWRTGWFGVIVEIGSHFVKVWDPKVTDSNTGLLRESSEWINPNCKMLKVIMD